MAVVIFQTKVVCIYWFFRTQVRATKKKKATTTAHGVSLARSTGTCALPQVQLALPPPLPLPASLSTAGSDGEMQECIHAARCRKSSCEREENIGWRRSEGYGRIPGLSDRYLVRFHRACSDASIPRRAAEAQLRGHRGGMWEVLDKEAGKWQGRAFEALNALDDCFAQSLTRVRRRRLVLVSP